MVFKRIPRHIGIIPDGNRRWAVARGMAKKDGYRYGIEPAKKAFHDVWQLGVQEVSVYIFTKENAHRPREQVDSFRQAFLEFLDWVEDEDVSLLAVGDSSSPLFPEEIKRLTVPGRDRPKKRRLNFLVNYSWEWDLTQGLNGGGRLQREGSIIERIGSRHVSKIDLVIRWGGRSRLSGFLPVQTAYANLHVIDSLWPDYEVGHLHDALRWYESQDITMGG